MKKLILACCAIVVIGGCLMLGGWAAGGQLYASYYNGALHPISESIRDIAYGMRNQWQYHSWVDEHGWHSGWFDDHLDNWIDDTVDHAVDDALDDFNTDWVDDWLDTRHEAIQLFDLPKASLDTIRDLDLTFKSGTSSSFTIESGADYGLEGDFSIVSNEFDNEKWELEITCNSDEVTLILPESVSSYGDIEIASRLDALVYIAVPLRASKIELHAESGSIDADLLSARELDLSVSDGLLYAYLDGHAQNYHIEAKSNYSPATLNDEELVGPNSGVSRYDNRKSVSNPINELEIHVNGGGTAELHTME